MCFNMKFEADDKQFSQKMLLEKTDWVFPRCDIKDNFTFSKYNWVKMYDSECKPALNNFIELIHSNDIEWLQDLND